MRIVSQNKRIDLPYEEIVITAVDFDGDTTAENPYTVIWANAPHMNDDRECMVLGKYSNEQAKEVMQLIRDAWQKEGGEAIEVEGNAVYINKNIVFEMPAERGNT